MSKISAIIVVKDSPRHVHETLSSINDLVDEILIFDIGIESELLKQLKKNSKVKVIAIKQSVPYIELIRDDLKKHAKNDYILYLDPDEIVTDQLKVRIKNEFDKHDFISIPRKNIIFGKWIQHSRWWPDYQVRVYRKDQVTWPRSLHAQAETRGKGLTLEQEENNAIVHHNYESLDEYITKSMRYAKSESQQHISDKKELTLQATISKSLSEFISRYFTAEGYKDGMHGFALAFLQMMQYFLVYFYYWEKNKYQNGPEESEAKNIKDFFQKGLYESTYWIDKKNKSSLPKRIKNKITRTIIKSF